MASLNLAGKNSGYVKITAPDDSSNNPTVTLPTESGELALKSDITGGGGGVEAQPPVAFSSTLSAAASMSNTGWTKVPFDTVDYDSSNGFNTTENKFQPNVAGYYQITFNARFNGNVKSCFGAVYLNGVEKLSTYNSSEKLSPTLLVEGSVYLNGTTDYVETFIFHGSDSAIDLSSVASHTYFQGHLITGQSSGGGSDTTKEVTVVDTAIGMVAPFAMDSVPTGWLHCDGSAVSRDTYSLLYSKVGDTYGDGDGTTTFNLPDLQDEFIRGSSDTLPVGNKQDDATAVNGLTDKGHQHSVRLKGSFGNSTVNGAVGTGGDADLNAGTSKVSADLLGDSETRPRNVAMLYCINATAEPSSGGGDYTPEKLVWEDKKAERELDTVYTNTNDVPLYVQIYTHANSSGKNAQMWIDGNYFGATGNTSGDTQQVNTNFYVIPSNSNYELRAGTNTPELKQWHEARMPVAVGTGGSASGDSIWTEEDGKAVYDGNVAVNGNLITNKGRDGGVHLSDDGLNNDFFPVSRTASKLGTWGTVRVYTTKDHEGLRIIGDTGQSQAFFMVVDSTGTEKFKVDNTGAVTSNSKALALTEEVDKKLAIKDKLIEKLEVRLDELEKRIK